MVVGCLRGHRAFWKERGKNFLDFIVAHQYIVTKGGWRYFDKILSKYKMAQSHPRFIDLEGFYEMFRIRAKDKKFSHVFYYPEDIVRN